MNRLFLLLRLFVLLVISQLPFAPLSAQTGASPRETALHFLQSHYQELGLLAGDVADLQVTDAYRSDNNGVTHVWVQQRYHSIPVFNGLIGLHVTPNQKVYSNGHRFVRDLANSTNTDLPSLSASRAMQIAMSHLGFDGFPTPSLLKQQDQRFWTFEAGKIAREPIEVKAIYARKEQGQLRLSWSVFMAPVNTADAWDLQIDAQTGAILQQFNQTIYCKADALAHTDVEQSAPKASASGNSLLLGEQYRVFPLPVESPNHGNRALLTNPADLLASPYGWLDTNGVAGEEFNYTRGNNVWAFDDSSNDNSPLPAESADGGPNHIFDFPYDPNAEPVVNRLAALTNLFYINNMVHDLSYKFGFDEGAGNFQVKNYSGQGIGNDGVQAQAFDGDGTNNASFETREDGKPGKMHMYLWNAGGGRIVQVNAPGVVSGVYQGNQGSWGAQVNNTPLTADVVFANDGQEPTLACEPLLNDVAGKIVMVDRGVCDFSYKALLVEQAGGVACIVCDHESPPISGGFGAGDYGNLVHIPAMYMSKADCNLLRQHAGAGLNITLVQPSSGGGPQNLDGSLDNGIMVHEYGHGISTRLTGGPANFECLVNKEQMGEGWSDFFMLTATVRPGDTGATKRGIGSYVSRQSTDSRGFRRYPYSTDMSINPLTFSAVSENPEIHALGEIWAVTLWDLYWAMVEKYGYDANLDNHNSGNARTIQLVMDGLKLQPCLPGFIDARDAIVLADNLNFGGADTCLISTVFARRGLGYKAQQGDTDVATDGVSDFDPIPVCVKTLKINKTALTPVLQPGDFAKFVITVTNHKGVLAPSVTVTDELPPGCTLFSVTNGGVQVGNNVVWHLGDMQDGQVITLEYSAKTPANIGSKRLYRDIMDTEDNWYSITLDNQHIQVFELQEDDVYSGTMAWHAFESTDVSDLSLECSQPVFIGGTQPVLRFWHKYNTESSADAGFLEFLDNDAPNPVWKRVSKDVTFRNGYTGKVSYFTFALPNHFGFSGNSKGWQQSYVDLSEFAGKNIRIRFRFGTNAGTAVVNGGWVVDEVELIDMVNYDTEAYAVSGNDQVSDKADARGVIMDPATVSTHEPDATAADQLFLQPNPATAVVWIYSTKPLQHAVQISLLRPDGRIMTQMQLDSLQAGQATQLDIRNVPPGMYWVRLESVEGRQTGKLMVH